jgi:hypothetical protein
MIDPLRGPAAKAMGVAGTLTIGGVRAGQLGAWRVVVSPKSTPEHIQYVLFADGRIGRFYGQAIGAEARAQLIPSAQPTRIGRKKPPTPKPFTLAGRIVEISAKRVVIADGAVVPT